MVKKGLALEEAPVFYPTEEEFQNALRYISAIREQAEPYGLCRIVPPPNWQPPFALPEDWRFQTKVQKVHHLQERQGEPICRAGAHSKRLRTCPARVRSHSKLPINRPSPFTPYSPSKGLTIEVLRRTLL